MPLQFEWGEEKNPPDYRKDGQCPGKEHLFDQNSYFGKNQKPTQEQIEEVREAVRHPIVYDDDFPEMTPAMEKAFRLAAMNRNRYP